MMVIRNHSIAHYQGTHESYGQRVVKLFQIPIRSATRPAALRAGIDRHHPHPLCMCLRIAVSLLGQTLEFSKCKVLFANV